MSRIGRSLKILAVCVLAAGLGACAGNYPTRTVSYQETPVDRPESPPGDAELLSVRIESFDTGTMPEDPNVAAGLSPEIRRAESYYIPVQLKDTMQKSGHWGPVRVVPRGTRDGEVIVSGRILESDGEILKLGISVRDAAGVHWFAREYESVIDAAAYQKADQGGVDPFQQLYNRIANDIAAHKKTLKAADMAALRQVAELRFGAEFAPAAFDGYLQRTAAAQTTENGEFQKLLAAFKGPDTSRKPEFVVARLPAHDDPVVQRVIRIRAREELLVDTLDQQYDGLARGVEDAYTQWRSSRLKEIGAIRAADREKNEEQAKGIALGVLGAIAGLALASQSNGGNCYGCATTGVIIAGTAVAVGVQMAMRASEAAAAETKLHKAALEELGQSLANDVKPTVVEVEGKTVELTGTIEEKFKQWRELLQELHEQDKAPLPVGSGAPVS